MKNIVVPIHFTHSADMDGVGCALLSLCVFEKEIYKNMDGEHMFIPPFIIPVGNNNKESYVKDFNMEKFTKFIEANIDVTDDEYENIEFVIIITDFCFDDDFDLEVFIQRLRNLRPSKNKYIRLWKFDHHESNPSFGKPYIFTNSCYLPPIVNLCNNQFAKNNAEFKKDLTLGYNDLYNEQESCSKDTSSENTIELSNKPGHLILEPKHDESMKQGRFDGDPGYRERTLELFKLLPESWDSVSPERSAIYVYFLFLYKTGLLRNVNDDTFFKLCRIVYHISNYDTYEFSKKDPLLPIVETHPDALTILYKSLHLNFFKMLFKLWDSVKDLVPCNWYSSGRNIEDWIPLTKSDFDRLNFLYEEREDTYTSDLKSMKLIPYSQIKNNLKLKFDDLQNDALVAVFPKNINDASYTGNRILEENPDVKMVLMMYTDNRTISLRSYNKDDNAPNVKNLAVELGGGGHKYAAGAVIDPMKFIILLNMCW